MKYMLVKGQEGEGGTIAAAVETYDTVAEARSAYHMELASALVSETLAADTVALIGTDGTLYALEHVDLGEAGK